MIMQDEMGAMPGADEEIVAPDAGAAADDVSTDEVKADEDAVDGEGAGESSI